MDAFIILFSNVDFEAIIAPITLKLGGLFNFMYINVFRKQTFGGVL